MLLHRNLSEESFSLINSGQSSLMSNHISPVPVPLLSSNQPLHSKVANLNFKTPNIYLATVNGQQCIVSPSDTSFHPIVIPVMQHHFSNHSTQSPFGSVQGSHGQHLSTDTSLQRHSSKQDYPPTSHRVVSDNSNDRTKKSSRPRSASLVSAKQPKPSHVISSPPLTTPNYNDADEGSAMEALTSAASALLAAADSAQHVPAQNNSLASHVFRVPSLPHSVSKSHHLHSHGSPPSLPSYHHPGSLTHGLASPVLPNVSGSVLATTSPHAHPAHALFLPSRIALSPSGSPRYTQLSSNQRKSHANVPQLSLSHSTPVSPHTSHSLSHLFSIPALTALQQDTLILSNETINQRRVGHSAVHHSSVKHPCDDSSLLSLLSACNASSRNAIATNFLSDGDSSDETSSSDFSSSEDEIESEPASSNDADDSHSQLTDIPQHAYTAAHSAKVHNDQHITVKQEKPDQQRKRPSQRRDSKPARVQRKPIHPTDIVPTASSANATVRKRSSRTTKPANALKVEIPVTKRRSRRSANLSSSPKHESPSVTASTAHSSSESKLSVEPSDASSDPTTVDSILNELMASEGAVKRGRATRNSLLSVLDSMLDTSPKKFHMTRRKAGAKDESCSESNSAPSTPCIAPHMSPSMPPLMLSPIAPSSTSSVGTSASQSLHLATPTLHLESSAAIQSSSVARSLTSVSLPQNQSSADAPSIFSASLTCTVAVDVKAEVTPELPLLTIEETSAEHFVDLSTSPAPVVIPSPSDITKNDSLAFDTLDKSTSQSNQTSIPPSPTSSPPHSSKSFPFIAPERSDRESAQDDTNDSKTLSAVPADQSSEQLVSRDSVSNPVCVVSETEGEDDMQECQDDLSSALSVHDAEALSSAMDAAVSGDDSRVCIARDCDDIESSELDTTDTCVDNSSIVMGEESESDRQARLKREERASAAFLKSLLKHQPARTRSEAKLSKVKRRIREHTLVELAGKRTSKRRRTSGESVNDTTHEATDSGDEQMNLEGTDTAAEAEPVSTSLAIEASVVDSHATASAPVTAGVDFTDFTDSVVTPDQATCVTDVPNVPVVPSNDITIQEQPIDAGSEAGGRRSDENKKAESSRPSDDADTESDEEAEQRPSKNSGRSSTGTNKNSGGANSESDSESDSSEDIDLSSTDLDEFSPSSTSSSSSEEVTESSSSEEEEQPKKRRRSELDKLHEGFAAIVHMEKKKSRRAERERIRQERKAADAALRDQLRQIRAEERYRKLKAKRVRLRAEIRARGGQPETPAERAAKLERRRAREAVLKVRAAARTERRRVREDARKKRREEAEAEEEAEADAEEEEAKILEEARKARSAVLKLEKQKRRELRRQRKKALLDELMKSRGDTPVKSPKARKPVEKSAPDVDKPTPAERESVKPKPRRMPKPVIPSRPTARQAIMSLIAEARDDSSSSSTDSPSSPEPPVRQTSKPRSSSPVSNTTKPKPSSSATERGASRAVVRKPPPVNNVKGLSAVERRRLEQEQARSSERSKSTTASTNQTPEVKAAPARSRNPPPSRSSIPETKQPTKPVQTKPVSKIKPPARASTSNVRPVGTQQKPPVKTVAPAKASSVTPSPSTKPPVVRRTKRIHDSDDDDVAAPNGVDGAKSTVVPVVKKAKVDVASPVAHPSTPVVSTPQCDLAPLPSETRPVVDTPAVVPMTDVVPAAPPRQAKTMNSSYWTDEELSSLRAGVEEFGHNFDAIKRHFTALFKRRTPPNLREKAFALALGAASK